MKRFLYSIALFFTPLIIVLLLIEYGIRQIPNTYAYKNNWLENNVSSIEILSVGSSHGYNGIQPQRFDKKAFNAAHPAQPLKYDSFIIDKFIDKADSLQLVILPVSYHSLLSDIASGKEWWREKRYCIYYHCPYHKREIKYCSEIYGIKLSSSIIRLWKFMFKGSHELYCDSLGFGANHKANRGKEWYQDGEIKAKDHTKQLFLHQTLIKENKSYIENIVFRCKMKHIKVVLLTIPTYYTYYDNVCIEQLDAMTHYCDSIASSNENVFYLNMFKDQRFDEGDFFNSDHLNEFGAEKLSRIMNDYCNSIGNL